MAALYVPEGSPPSPFLPPGPFQAVFEGLVSVDLGTDCVFSAQGSGAVQVTVNGKPALDAKGPELWKTEGKADLLKKGKNKLVMTYKSPEKGDAWVRLYWVSSDFPQEPVGPQAATHVVTAKAGLVGLTRALAHELAAQNVTVNCVSPGRIATARRGPEPNAHRVPSLTGT